MSSINFCKASKCSTESGTGLVLGIGHTVVNPPLAAALVPVSIVSYIHHQVRVNEHEHRQIQVTQSDLSHL
ncbi:Uncharacterised protein [Staphylococcus aureus]|uniref:Uncharacterized protein n=1 Tax=Staphylococcus aureus TaxID=1280 RepID=A0A380E189_STAAU|nr:Uncharacterised protein [Staphylococcus aureus]